MNPEGIPQESPRTDEVPVTHSGTRAGPTPLDSLGGRRYTSDSCRVPGQGLVCAFGDGTDVGEAYTGNIRLKLDERRAKLAGEVIGLTAVVEKQQTRQRTISGASGPRSSCNSACSRHV